MSGGEQQMLAIARALVARPKVLRMDEPSQGPSPLMVGEMVSTVARMNGEGMTVLLIDRT